VRPGETDVVGIPGTDAKESARLLDRRQGVRGSELGQGLASGCDHEEVGKSVRTCWSWDRQGQAQEGNEGDDRRGTRKSFSWGSPGQQNSRV